MRLTRASRAAVRCVIASLLAVAILAMTAPAAFAAGGVYGTLSGTVVDATTHNPISGASVSVKSPSNSYSATTDGGGHFTILGISVDTYTVTITAAGHDTVNVPGVTVFGDQINSISTVSLEPHLATIARVTSRSVSSAYQPTQTTDTYTINQQQILQSTGNPHSADENSALLSVPGVTLTNTNSSMGTQVTIRGGMAAEIGYQFDGVPFREPFLGQNSSFGLMNGLGSIQVVEGAGDATQGEIGAGVINVIPQRGSGPGSGNVFLGVGGPNYNHQLAVQYGFSTPDNRFSEFVSFNGQRYAPYNGYSFTPLNEYGTIDQSGTLATTYATQNQFMNNFFFKFGKDLNQQIQALYLNVSQTGYGGYTGCGGLVSATNTCALSYYPYDSLTQGYWIGNFAALGAPNPAANYAQLIGLGPGVPSTPTAITTPQQNFSNTTTFLKLEYDNNLSPTTYLALRYYNYTTLESSDDSYTLASYGTSLPGTYAWEQVGGQTVGMNLDILHQFGSNLTVTLNGQYNVLYPEFSAFEPQVGLFGLGGTGLLNQPGLGDWFSGGYLCGGNTLGKDYFDCAAPGAVSNTRIPIWGIGYSHDAFQEWGTGVRFQYNPTSKLRFDLGIRDEGQIRHWVNELNQFGEAPPAVGCSVNVVVCPAGDSVAITNPFDIPASSWETEPTTLQPRGSISYELSSNDSIRASYGRSVVYADAQTAGTPFEMYGLASYASIPAIPGSTCGWTSAGFGTRVWPCRSYAEQLYWQGDNVEAPDAENIPPAVYTNYDISYNHLFPSGWGMRVTGFNKLGTSLPDYFLLNPVIGIFAISNLGENKTTGAEFDLTTPQRAVGLSGFLAATYQNVLSSVPPFTTAENLVPTVPYASLQLGDLYRAGYVSPFSMRLGGLYNFKNGLSVSPQLQFNIGYPYTIGNTIAGCLALAATGICGQPSNVPQVDFGPGITGGQASLIGGNPGAAISTNYYDPANPGSITNPNIAATRGTPATSSNGGYLSHFNLEGDLTVQYKWNRNTIGVQMLNLFGNAYINSVPAVNPWYQPVATGLSGPQTNYNSCVNQIGAGIRGCYAQIPAAGTYAFTNGAYLLTNGNNTAASPTLGPLQPFSVQVYFQRAF